MQVGQEGIAYWLSCGVETEANDAGACSPHQE